MELLVAVSICCGFCCAIIAEKKHRDLNLWFYLGILFGIFALITIALLPSAL